MHVHAEQIRTESSATNASVRLFIDVMVAEVADNGSAKNVILLKTQYSASSFLLRCSRGFIIHTGSLASAICTSAAAEYPCPYTVSRRSSAAIACWSHTEPGAAGTDLCCSCQEV